MDVSEMDQTWVPSMPPLLSPNLKVFGLNFGTVPLPEKILRTILEKTGKFERENEWGRGFTQNNLKIHNVTTAFRIADTPAEPQTDLRW